MGVGVGGRTKRPPQGDVGSYLVTMPFAFLVFNSFQNQSCAKSCTGKKQSLGEVSVTLPPHPPEWRSRGRGLFPLSHKHEQILTLGAFSLVFPSNLQ